MNATMQAWLTPVLTPATWVYAAVVSARNRRFDRGQGIVRLSIPVISVGNVSVGGAGKSPTVRWIAELVKAEGVTPVIAMRGYGAKQGGKSDEQREHEELLPGVDVVASPDRVQALHSFLATRDDVGCVILDDGFQHRRVARDLDIVLVDAQQPQLNDRLIPAGRLREPIENLQRADAVVVTRAERVDKALARHIESLHGKPPLAWFRHAWTRLRIYSKGSPEGVVKPVTWLEGMRVATMAGVGNPGAFERQVAAAGAAASMIAVRDHQVYDVAWLNDRDFALADFTFNALVTTHKDWVKIRQVIDLSDWQTPIVVPELAIEVIEGEAAMANLVRSVLKPALRNES